MKAVGYRILLEYNSIYDTDPDFKRAKQSGLALPEEHEEMQRRNAGIDTGVVYHVGPQAEKTPGLKKGDFIGFAKHSGKVVTSTKTKEKFIVINDEDVLYVE